MEIDLKIHWFDTGNGGERPYYWEVEANGEPIGCNSEANEEDAKAASKKCAIDHINTL